MAIVKMKKLHLIGLISDEPELMKRIQSLGCVEISSQQQLSDSSLSEPGIFGDSHWETDLQTLTRALKVLDTCAPAKTPIFAPRPEYTETRLFDDDLLSQSLEASKKILSLDSRMNELASAQAKAETAKLTLTPWENMDIPLGLRSTAHTAVKPGVCPVGISFDLLEEKLGQQVPEAELMLQGSDREQHYLVLVVHRIREEEALSLLRAFGWSPAPVDQFSGTAAENMLAIDMQLQEMATQRQQLTHEVSAYAHCRGDIELGWERCYQDVQRQQAAGRLLSTQKCFCLSGWVPETSTAKLEKLFARYDCAYELSDPQPDDDVPVRLKSNWLTEPMNLVTEMYSLPAYDGVDPNPLILPFFTLFFGLMYADMGYGLILLAVSLFVTKRFKPRGTMGRMMGLGVLCGVTTVFWGILFGSFFGDAVPVLCNLLNIEQVQLWKLIDPLEQPMVMLIASLALGAVHLVCGMAINAILLIKDGKALDALFDVGSWWLLFAGIALGALGKTWLVCIAGATALVLTQGRSKPTLAGKLIGGLASLYDITSYLGDILSYTRLMALMLASSVIASVVNVLGSLSGSIIVFVVVFLVGHAFNMGISIIGTYVHAARLQYLEFFGKFYKDGGRAFAPLAYKTKYSRLYTKV